MTTTFVALLRGINLGSRKVKSADLLRVYESLGFANVRTLLASGNVLFDTEEQPDRDLLETAFARAFGFSSGTVLRRQQELRELVDSDPFAGITENQDRKLYVTFFAAPVTLPTPLPEGGEDFKVAKVREREICLLAYRQPNGRFGPGMDTVTRDLPKALLHTTRNWNTVLKAALNKKARQ